MKIKNLLLILVVLLSSMMNNLKGTVCEKYSKLKFQSQKSIKQNDLPSEFSENAFKIINEFIKKCASLNYEFVMYFDYVTGEIINCASGEFDYVEIEIDAESIAGKNIASIHNHPKEVLSPPSGKNFGIFERGYEDYELIVGFEYFWILKAKGIHKNLAFQMNMVSEVFYQSSLESCSSRYGDIKIINKMHDIIYGNELLKYINNKNINNIQLTKKEYCTMDNVFETAEYSCRKHVTDPEEIRLARERENDPNILSGRDKAYAMYKAIGMDVEYDEIFSEK